MPRPVPVLSMEELAARQERARELKRAKNKRYYEAHTTYFREYYQNDKERICARGVRIYIEKKAAKAAAAAPPTPPDL